MAYVKIGWIGLFILLVNPIQAQDDANSSLTGMFRTRYMSTFNKADLADFSILVSHGHLDYQQKATDWLSFQVRFNGLIHYGTNGITKRDGITGSGPIYEGNLWAQNNMTGAFESKLSQFNAQLKFGNHKFIIGRLLKNTPTINIEPWPFPNSLEGIWYEYANSRGFRFQSAFIDRICPRQTGDFFNIGESIGKAGTGIDVFGNPSQYRGNVQSDYILISNLDYTPNDKLQFDFWNYYVDNVSNTGFLETKYNFSYSDLRISNMLIYQSKVGNGGNADPNLAYQNDDQAFYWGLRAEKSFGENGIQFNINGITSTGRLLLPREWGLEPFYTFQRRTRIEGQKDVTSVMLKWTRNWIAEKQDVKVFAGIGRIGIKDPSNLASNKNLLPRFYHLDMSVQYKPHVLKGFSAELYLAKRFSAGEVPSDSYVINRTDLFHIDFFVTYTFGK